MNPAPAVLLGLYYMGLAAARSLGRKGIPVFGIDKDPDRIGAKSRYLTFLGSPSDDGALLETLLDFGKSCRSKSVLFPFTDDYLIFISRNREVLSRYYWFPYPNDRPLEHLVSKDTMSAIFKELGISSPERMVLAKDSIGELKDFRLAFPVVIKPNFHAKWLGDPDVIKNIGTRKTLLISDFAALERYCSLLTRYDTIIVQEFVPGKTENLYYYVGYRNAEGEMLASFVGKKLRTFPDMFGSESLLQSVHHSSLRKLGDEVLRKLNYVGPAGLDFKFDARDQTYKLIEINCRLGISDGLLVDCGVDIPYLYYADVQGMAPRSQLDYKQNVYWCWFARDMEWFREYRARDGYTKWGWIAHFLLNTYSHPVYTRDDLKPAFCAAAGFLKKLSQKFGRR